MGEVQGRGGDGRTNLEILAEAGGSLGIQVKGQRDQRGKQGHTDIRNRKVCCM